MNTLPAKTDQSREGVNLTKIAQCFKLLFSSNTKTLNRLEKFTDLDIDKIKRETGIEIKGLILDIDGCLSYNHGEILPENLEHLRTLIARGVKIIIYSNMAWSERYKDLEGQIEVLTNVPPKPDPAGFSTALEKLSLPKENVAMVGDNYLTDGGAIQEGINFIHINPLRRKDEEKLTEKAHSAIRGFFIWVSKLHEKIKPGGR